MRAEAWDAPFGLHGYRWPVANARATVLLQHGYAEHAGRYVEHYHRLVPRLVERGFEVRAFDLAGHGRSPGARGLTDIGRVADAHIAARRMLAGRPVFLFGHSLGGLVTALSVARVPNEMAGVVLSGPALPFGAGLATRAFARVMARVAPAVGVAALGPPDGISRIEAEVLAYTDDPLVFRRKIPARLGWTALAAAGEIERGLPRWRAPTFVFYGQADSYADPKGSARLVAGIAATDKELWLVPDGRHELLNDLPRDKVLALVIGWLEARV